MLTVHVTLLVLLVLTYLSSPCTGQNYSDVQMWLSAGCSCKYNVQEQTGTLQVCVEIVYVNGTATTTSAYHAMMTTTSGSAIGGADYTSLSFLTLTFPEGSSVGDSRCTAIVITDDDAVENTESFTVSLSTNDSRVDFSPICTSAPVDIQDSDVITYEVISPLTEDVCESPAVTKEICLNITSGCLEIAVSAPYRTQSGTATHSPYSDYQYRSSSVSFSSGLGVGDVRCVTVSIYDDTRVENDEYFTVSFQSGSRVTVDPNANSVRITIIDDDVAVIGMETSEIFETEASVYVPVCAVLLQSQRLEVNLNALVDTMAGTATGGRDYNEAVSLGISFFSGDLTGARRCLNIRINEDTILEYDESLQVMLTEDSPRLLIDSGSNTTQITILEDQDTVSIGFQSLQFSSTEGTSAVAEVCAQITAGTLERSVSVYLTTADQTATDGVDYVPVTSQEVTFISGQSFNSMSISCLNLTIIDDSTLEDQESFSITLASMDTEVIITNGRAQAVVLIKEDPNDAVLVGFPTGPPLTVTEGDEGSITICLEILVGTLERDVSVFARTSDLTATGSSDYTPIASEEVTFTNGQTTSDIQCISVAILDDNNVLEVAVETFEVLLTANDTVVSFPAGQENTTVNINEDTLDGVTIGLEMTTYFTDETGGPLTICARMFLGNLERNLSVTLVSADGTAVAPGDYSNLNTQIVFTVGQSTGAVACADLQVVDDNVVEEDEESLDLTMSADEPLVTATTAVSATVTIRENDNDVVGSVAFTSTNYDAFEADGAVDVCIFSAATAFERNITVLLTSQDGNATNAVDYTAFQFQPITFASGAQFGDEMCHTTAVVNDDILEGSEIFTVTLSSNEPAFLGSNSTQRQATVTINPDPADSVVLAFQSSAYFGTEELSLRDVTICVEVINGSLERDVVINVSATNGTAKGGIDYTGPTPSVITFSPGQTVGDENCIVVSVLDDSFIENKETFNLTLSVSSADVNSVAFSGQGISTFTITQDPNDKAVVRLLNSTLTEMEGQNLSVCMVLSGEVQIPLSAIVESTSGSADVGVDFNVFGPATVIFPPNRNIQCVMLELLTDSFLEGPENFVVHLNTNDSALTVDLNAGITIVTIIDVPEPNAVGVSFISVSYIVTENTTTVEVCVAIAFGIVALEETVEVETISGTATVDRDITSIRQSLRFFPGETIGASRCLSITILDDKAVEADETCYLTISSTGAVQAIVNTTANITIYPDSDFVVVGLAAMNLTVKENETYPVCVEITSGETLERDVFIGLEVQNSSAQEGVDFVGPDPPFLTFTAGQSEGDVQCANVTILDDSVLDGERNFSIILVPSDGGDDGGEGGRGGGGGMGGSVQVDANTPSIDIRVEVDIDDFITVGLSQLMYHVTEGPLLGPLATVSVCVTIELGSLGSNVSVILMTPVNGSFVTATPNLDFIPIAETVTLTEGQSQGDSVCAEILIVRDDVIESQETFEVLLLPHPDYTLAAVVQPSKLMAIVTISDHEDFMIGLVDERFTVTESVDHSILLCAELQEGNLQRNLTVAIVTVGTNATAGVDFLITPENLTFTAGQSAFDGIMQCATVEILDDEDAERREVLILSLAPAVPEDANVVVISPANNVTVIIIIEDPSDKVQISPLTTVTTVTEGNMATFCLGISLGSLQRDIQVNVRSITGASPTATPGKDYYPYTGIVNLTSNEPVCSNITIIDDDNVEECEAFLIGFEVDTTSSGVAVVPKDVDKMVIVIVDDFFDGVEIGFNQSELVITEGNSTIVLCVGITSGTLEREVTVYLETVSSVDALSGNALPDRDYQEVKQQKLTFGPSSSSTCSYIDIYDDDALESTESFTVSLTVPVEDSRVVSLSVQKVTVLIREDSTDGIVVGLSQSVFRGSEENGSVTVCVELVEGELEKEVSILLEIVKDSAISDEDHISVAEELSFASGQPPGSLTCVNITIVDDIAVDGKEAFMVVLSQPSTGVDISPSRARSMVEFTDTDQPEDGRSTDNTTVIVVVPIVVLLVCAAVVIVLVMLFLIQKQCKQKKVAPKDVAAFVNPHPVNSKGKPSVVFNEEQTTAL